MCELPLYLNASSAPSGSCTVGAGYGAKEAIYRGLQLSRTGCQVSGIDKEVRTMMSQTQLSALSLLAIKHELVSALDFKDIVHQFEHSKSRKMPV